MVLYCDIIYHNVILYSIYVVLKVELCLFQLLNYILMHIKFAITWCSIGTDSDQRAFYSNILQPE